MKARKSGDWWTENLSPWSGCKDLALAPEQRATGCQKCWLPSLLTGPRGRVIHGELPPWEIVLHPERLAQALRKRAPQRYGWINGEVADVATDRPEYLAACVGVALARPDHGFGVPTSDPAALVTWTRWYATPGPGATPGIWDGHDPMHTWGIRFGQYHAGVLFAEQVSTVAGTHTEHRRPALGSHFPPRNWLWLISASTQQEVDERMPHARTLAEMGWRVGLHLEPLLESLDLDKNCMVFNRRAAVRKMVNGPACLNRDQAEDTISPVLCSWVASGPPKGHGHTEAELNWHREIRDQARYAGVPYFYKGEPLDGCANTLPAGWPGSEEVLA